MIMKKFLRLSSTLSFCLLTNPAYGVNWIGTGDVDGDFNEPSNWGGGLPDSGKYAVVSVSDTLNLTEPITARGVRVNSGASVIVDASGAPLSINSSSGTDFSTSGGGQLTVIGDIISLGAGSTLNLSGAGGGAIVLDGAEVGGSPSSGDSVRFDGNVTLTGATKIDSTIEQVDVIAGSVLKVAGGGNSISGDLLLFGGSGLSFEDAGDQLVVGSISTPGAEGGDWIFDLTSTNSNPYLVAGDISLDGTFLDLSNLSASVESRNPVILASYSGLLSGGEFAGITGLAPNQKIDYDFNGQGLIAIVPEASLVAPIFAGFLPFFIFRRRSRR